MQRTALVGGAYRRMGKGLQEVTHKPNVDLTELFISVLVA